MDRTWIKKDQIIASLHVLAAKIETYGIEIGTLVDWILANSIVAFSVASKTGNQNDFGKGTIARWIQKHDEQKSIHSDGHLNLTNILQQA